MIESITPFHLISLGLVYISTLSLSAVFMKLFEPVRDVYFNLLLTFPLTIGLIIIFLILINANWHKVTLMKILSAPLLFALLFVGLNQVSKRFGLEKMGAANEIDVNKNSFNRPDKEQTKTFVQPLTSEQAQSHLKETANSLTKGLKPSNGEGSNSHWYFKNFVVVGPVWLVNEFVEFYQNYKPLHFFFGIFIAAAFTYYIQKKIIKRA